MTSKTTTIPGNVILQEISEATSRLTGKDYLLELTKKISLLMRMDYCFVAECADEKRTRLRTIAFVKGEQVLNNIEYNTADSACQMLMNGEPYILLEGVQKLFPAAKGIESYIGVPILSTVTGEMLGHIAASSGEAITEQNQVAILKIFASRIGAELERIKSDNELCERNKELQRKMKENEFYAFTLDHLREAVFWIDEDGAIWQVNDKATELSGYSKEELKKMHVFDINESVQPPGWPVVWNRLKEKKIVVFDARFKRKDGIFVDIEITQNFMVFEGREYTCSLVRDIRKRKMEEELIRTISEHTAGITGESYLYELAKFVTASLDVRYAMVSKYANPEHTRLKMLSYIDRQEPREGWEYDPIGTPCEVVVKGNTFFCADKLEVSYPREKGIQAWLSVPIYSPTTGGVIGTVCAFDDKPMRSEQNQPDVLKIFAARAGAEMERIEAQGKLEQANDELKVRLKEIEMLKNQLQLENKYLQEEIKLTYNFEEIISKSKDFQKVLQQIEQVASTDSTVLILGESGTGKELIARAVHNISNRSKRPLVKVNCATLPANLIESELFGHEKGAFTGAMDRKIGRFELADGGSIFLDELGELPVELQAKLLRVLQEGEFERLGNPRTMKVNVRVIAATNRNLQQAIEKKEFREDLYYRLNVFPIICPPLRNRKEDIPLLVKHFCQKHEAKIGKKITNVPAKVIDALMSYNWPGNIRELENIIERALILSRDNTLEYGEWVPTEKFTENGKTSSITLEDVEKEHIIDTLKKTNWKVSGEKGAAKILGLNATTLEARMKKLGIKRNKE